MSFIDLYEVAKTGEVEKLFDEKQNLICNIHDSPNEFGWTPLVIASFNQNIEMMEFLINKGANVNYYNQNGTSVLMYAKTKLLFTKPPYNSIDLLISNGASILHKDKKRNWTIIDYIENEGDFELANYLNEKIKK
jgi:ankyrin repeat protein